MDLSPMDIAAMEGQIEKMKLLKTQGANVNAKDSEGETALHKTAQLGKIESIKCLKELGADLNARNNEGSTPMHLAAIAGQAENIKCLADLGADVNARDNDGYTPLFNAAMAHTGQVESIKCLTALGADIEARGNSGRTPIFAAAAAEFGQIAAMECLKELGAKLDVKDKKGETAVDLADALDETKVAEWLRVNGVGYEQLVQKMGKASTENEYQELAKKFRAYKNTAELISECETRIINIQKAAKRREHLMKIAPISPVLLAVLTVVITIFGFNYIQQTKITGESILGAIILAIPFLVIYLTGIYRKVLKGVFLVIGVLLTILWVYILGDGANNGLHVFIIAAYFICNIASYILAMIFPKDSLRKW